MFEGLFQPMHLILITAIVLMICGPLIVRSMVKGRIEINAAKAATSTTLCPHCGCRIAQHARFCTECGKGTAKTAPS
jgi:hypothetical protein